MTGRLKICCQKYYMFSLMFLHGEIEGRGMKGWAVYFEACTSPVGASSIPINLFPFLLLFCFHILRYYLRRPLEDKSMLLTSVRKSEIVGQSTFL